MSAPDRYAVIGHPVAHSRSPAIHAAFAAETGEVLHYERLLAPLDGFAQTVRDFAASGARGCNVTLPFKFEALSLAARRSERATLAGAANTLRFDAEGWLADNTDGIGLVRDIEVGASRPLAGQRVLLIGAGGAGAGVLGPLLACRPAEVRVVNRTVSRAEELAARHAVLAVQHGTDLDVATLDAPGEGFDVVINASASSLGGGAVPVPASALRPGSLAVDLMYGAADRKSTRLNSSHSQQSRMPSSA